MSKGLIIDGWNLFSYEGIPNDTEDKKTLAFKQLGDYCVEVFLDLKTMSFELVNYLQSKGWNLPSLVYVKSGFKFNAYNDNHCAIKCNRFSTCLKLADEWFKSMEEKYE